MSLSTYMERLKYVDDLIRRKATGNPESLAKKLQLSRSHAMSFIQELKEHGFPIEYSRKIESYYDSYEVRLNLNLFNSIIKIDEENQTELSRDQLRKISGGRSLFNIFIPSDYIRRNDLNFEN